MEGLNGHDLMLSGNDYNSMNSHMLSESAEATARRRR